MPNDATARPRIHVVSETPFVMKGQGVHTAFVDLVDLLKEDGDLEVVVNQEGWGDVMHAHTYGPYLFWKGRRYKGRRVYTVHVIPDSIKGSLPAWKLFMPFVRWYLKRVYGYADVCLAISPFVAEAIEKLGAKTRIVRLANPIHLDKFVSSPERRRAGRRLLGVDENAFVALGVGQLEGRKGVEDFLDIAEAFPEQTFVWAGGRPFGVMTEGIAKLARRIKAAVAHVKFPGLFELEQMPLIYAAGDVLLFPSYQENCPLVPLEAAAAGLPVIYRDIPEYRVLYERPYLKAKDTPEFIALLKRLVEDPAFRQEARAVSAGLVKQFDKHEIRSKLVELYKELLG